MINEGPNYVLVTTYFIDSFQSWDEEAKSWLVQNETTVYVPMNLLLPLKLNIVSRILCSSVNSGVSYIFSNFNSALASQQILAYLTIGDLLKETVDVPTKKAISKCGRTAPTDLSYQYTFKNQFASSGEGHVEDCCSTSCPYAGYAYGKGADISIQYNWTCSLDLFNDPDKDRYSCAAAQGGLVRRSDIISSTSAVTRTGVVETPVVKNNQ